MSQLPQLHIVTKILLQDDTLIRNWWEVSYSLELPTADLNAIRTKYGKGNTTMFEIIYWTLETWRGRTGAEANLTNLIKILEDEKLSNAAALLMEHNQGFQKQSGSTPLQIVFPTKSASNEVQLLNGNLVILERIDEGAFSQVLKVRSIVDKKLYAIKKICVGQFLQLTKTSGAADAVEFFTKLMREVFIMSKLPSENVNIVGYQDAFFEGPLQETFTKWLVQPELMPCPSPVVKNAPKHPIIPSEGAKSTFMYIKMELMDTNLGHWLKFNRNNIRDFETYKNITRQIFTGLASIHERNFVHRDLHPNNILLNIRGDQLTVKIGDFGLSREMPEVDTALTLQVGGRRFASPEMERGDTYDFKTDIFSVGLIVLVMLHPFENDKKMDRTFEDIRGARLEIVTSVERNIGKTLGFLRSMLDRKPENRPTAQQALDILNQ